MPGLNIVEKVIALEGVELLRNLTPEQLARIAGVAREVKSPPGVPIFEAGKPLDALYVIVDGAVELSRNGELFDTARRNHILGAWALFEQDDPAPVAARAVEDTRLLRIGCEDFHDLLADNSEIASAIFSTLVKRFRGLMEQYSMVESGAGRPRLLRDLREKADEPDSANAGLKTVRRSLLRAFL